MKLFKRMRKRRRLPDGGINRPRVSAPGTVLNPVPGPSIEREDGSAPCILKNVGFEREELAGVGGERLDVVPPPLDVQSVERERQFPRAQDACDDDEFVPGDRGGDIFEIVLGIKEVRGWLRK